MLADSRAWDCCFTNSPSPDLAAREDENIVLINDQVLLSNESTSERPEAQVAVLSQRENIAPHASYTGTASSAPRLKFTLKKAAKKEESPAPAPVPAYAMMRRLKPTDLPAPAKPPVDARQILVDFRNKEVHHPTTAGHNHFRRCKTRHLETDQPEKVAKTASARLVDFAIQWEIDQLCEIVQQEVDF